MTLRPLPVSLPDENMAILLRQSSKALLVGNEASGKKGSRPVGWDTVTRLPSYDLRRGFKEGSADGELLQTLEWRVDQETTICWLCVLTEQGQERRWGCCDLWPLVCSWQILWTLVREANVGHTLYFHVVCGAVFSWFLHQRVCFFHMTFLYLW